MIETGVKGACPPGLPPPLGGERGVTLAIPQKDALAMFSPEQEMVIAIMIAVENRSGKIRDRFSDQIRSAVFGSKSIPEIYFQIDPRGKNRFRIILTDGTNIGNRFFFKIGSRVSFENRSPVFIFQSGSDFFSQIAITIPIKNFSGKIGDRFSDQIRSAVFLEQTGSRFSDFLQISCSGT